MPEHEGITFTSDSAAERADDAELVAADFSTLAPSSTGGYTVDDVKLAVAMKGIAPGALRCRGPRAREADDALREAFAEGDLEGAREIDRAARPGCGFDLRRVMAQGALDGSIEEAECPECGQVVSFRHVPAE